MAGAQVRSVAENLIGRRLMGRYTVCEHIAYGGMGVTYRGTDERLRRSVCIKVYRGLDPSRPHYATVLEHFVQEAFTLSRLRHPNTLRIYDFGHLEFTEAPTPFFVTEYAEGGTLKDYVKGSGTLDTERAREILEAIVEALQEAHGCGIVHRDVKPSNILFTFAGASPVAKLADFSVSSTGAGDHGWGDHGPMYSPNWAAPEQVGDRAVGPPADVFALALTTIFMLTGQRIYTGTDLHDLFMCRRLGMPYREQKLRTLGLEPELESVLLAALSESPLHRPQSVRTFYDEVADALDANPSSDSWSARADAPTSRDGMPVVRELIASPGPTHSANCGHPVVRLSDLNEPVMLPNRCIVPQALRSEVTLGQPHLPIRVRLTPLCVNGWRIHIKGLNCFLRKTGGRPSSGCDITKTTEIEFIAANGTTLDNVRVIVGAADEHASKFELGDAHLWVPHELAPWAAVFDPTDGRDALLLYQSTT